MSLTCFGRICGLGVRQKPSVFGNLISAGPYKSRAAGAINKEFEARQMKMREMHAMHMQHFAELHAILTPEQRNKLADFMENRTKEMKDRWMRNRKDDKDGKDEPQDSK